MSQWYEHRKSDGNHLWLYSERGLMSFLFCHLLADRLDFVLDNAKDEDGITPLRLQTCAMRPRLSRDRPRSCPLSGKFAVS